MVSLVMLPCMFGNVKSSWSKQRKTIQRDPLVETINNLLFRQDNCNQQGTKTVSSGSHCENKSDLPRRGSALKRHEFTLKLDFTRKHAGRAKLCFCGFSATNGCWHDRGELKKIWHKVLSTKYTLIFYGDRTLDLQDKMLNVRTCVSGWWECSLGGVPLL